MNKALFKTGNTIAIINARDINSRKEYKEKYIGKLYCTEHGCNARLVYAELPFERHSKIFKTHPGSEHSTSCPHQITHERTNGPTFSSATFSQAISDKHVKSVLDSLYKRNTEPEIANPPSRIKGSISKHPTKDSTTSFRGRAEASINKNAEPVVAGEREPTVKKRKSQDIISEDNGRLRGIDGKITQAHIGEDYIELYFESLDIPLSLLFYNSFRDKSNQAYQLVQELAKLLNETDLTILTCCLGVVEALTDKTQVQIMGPEYITFEGLSIYNYVRLKSA